MISRHEHRSPLVVAAVACMTALVLAGCGGGSSSNSSSKSTSAAAAASASTSAAASSSLTSAGTISTSASGSLTPSGAGGTGGTSAPSGSGAASPRAQAYALKLVPLAEAWQAAAQHYDNVVGSAGSGNLGLIASSSRTFAAATNRFADRIAALTPPPGVSSAQAGLVAAVRALGGDVTELESAAVNHDPAKARDAQSKVGPDGKAVSSAVLALAAAAQKSQ